MAHGIVTPLPRIVGPTDSEISGEIIPAGVSPSYSPFVGSGIDIARLDCRVDRRNDCSQEHGDIPRSLLV